MPVLFRLLDRRITVFFLATILSAAFFVPPSQVNAQFYCWCRNNTTNTCNNYERPGTYDATTSATACRDFCTGRREEVIATERPYGTEFDERAADICSHRGNSGGPCVVGGSCNDRHVAGLGTQRYTCSCTIEVGVASIGGNFEDIYSPEPSTVTAETTSQAQTRCRAKCEADLEDPDGVGLRDSVYEDRVCSLSHRVCTAEISYTIRSVNVTEVTGAASVTPTGGPGSPGATNTNGPVSTDPGSAASRAGRTAILSDPLGGVSIPQLLGRVINVFLGISGSLALVVFVYGGFEWLTSAGNPEKIKKGKDAFVWATLGLMVVFGAYAIVNFILRAILSAAG